MPPRRGDGRGRGGEGRGSSQDWRSQEGQAFQQQDHGGRRGGRTGGRGRVTEGEFGGGGRGWGRQEGGPWRQPRPAQQAYPPTVTQQQQQQHVAMQYPPPMQQPPHAWRPATYPSAQSTPPMQQQPSRPTQQQPFPPLQQQAIPPLQQQQAFPPLQQQQAFPPLQQQPEQHAPGEAQLQRGRGRRGRGRGPAVSEIPEQPQGAPEALAGRVEALDIRESEQAVGGNILSALLPEADEKAAESSPSSSKAIVAAARPDKGGSAGKTNKLRINHFKIALKAKVIFHYDVSIHPAVSSKAIARALQRELVAQYRVSDLGNRLPVYDGGKSLYTAGPLPFDRKEFEVHMPQNATAKAGATFKVTIKLAAKLDQHHMDLFLSGTLKHLPQEFIQALDVTLREWPMKLYAPSGRSFFDPSFGRQKLENGLEAWKGFYQSVRPSMQGLVLNVDLSATAFLEPLHVLEFLRQSLPSFNPNKGFTDSERVRAKKLLFRLKIEVVHRPLPRRYRISGLSSKPTKSLTFPLEDGTEVKVMDYFRNKYGHNIRFPELPCLELQGKNTTYLPIEVCKLVEGQKFSGKLNERQTTNILRFACQVPAAREREITTITRDVHGIRRNEYATEFGITISETMTSLQGRILPPPRLRYMNNEINPSRGDWNMMESRFIRGGTVLYWGLVNFASISTEDANYFKDALIMRCEQIGMKIEQPLLPIAAGRIENYHQVITKFVQDARTRIKEKQLQLIVVLMDNRHQLYDDLKRLCDTELGVITQCCLKKNVMRDDRSLSQYLANLAMKINVKVGGQNVVLSQELSKLLPTILNVPTIIFGADVSHPMVRDDSSPSISAVVASMDWPSATRYLARARAQTHRVERIQGLEGMVYELLMEFISQTHVRPQKLLFFRDGVSEGQFYDVLENEVTAILSACMKVDRSYRPQVTFVVVQKRHHTRFFPANQQVVGNNVSPGTVVDTVITHPREFDFYLCSHKGQQGTSRPAHYHVLLDENKFKSDQLQMLINNLCYTYARCTKAVSIVPPAYYAHLVAFRARRYMDTGSEAGSTASSSVVRIGASPLPPVKRSVQEHMYYC